VKLTLVCVLLGCVSLSPAQELSAWSGESVDVQRLLKFSGTLTASHRAGIGGAPAGRFTIYSGPNGGEAYWEETQNVRPDAQGRYPALLGSTTLGGLPPDIFASRGSHWLGVQVSGQPEQARVLLVPTAWKPDPISNRPISKPAILSDPTERHLALILLIMFLAGTAMACGEVRKWWRTRTEQYGASPFANLVGSAPNPDSVRRAAEVVRFPLTQKFRALREHFQHSTQSGEDDQPTKAA